MVGLFSLSMLYSVIPNGMNPCFFLLCKYSFLLLLLYLFIYLYVGGGMCMHKFRLKENLEELVLIMWVPGIELGHQGW